MFSLAFYFFISIFLTFEATCGKGMDWPRPGLIDYAQGHVQIDGCPFFIFAFCQRTEKWRDWGKITKLVRRERWFTWVAGGGDMTEQRSNRQRNDQDERESKAVTMQFYALPSTWSDSTFPTDRRHRQDWSYGRDRGIETLCYRNENVAPKLLGLISFQKYQL